MNPDIPSFETCKRLAVLWPHEDALWFYSQMGNLMQGARGPAGYTISAPTIGEMLAEIRRCGWRWNLERKQSQAKVVASIRTGRYKEVWMADKEPADALALVLCAAMEEGKR